jgi:YbbR domain-containing protein
VNGQIANGYRLTNMSVFPPVVTVFSADPQLVNNLPGFIETAPLDLRDAKNDLDVHLKLNLPQGVTVVGDQTVEVVVGIAAIEGSLTLSNKPIEIIGLTEGLTARTSPETIDVILSGPLPELDALVANDVKVVIDLTGENVGTYQRSPRVDINNPDLKVESILPSSVEVVVSLIPGQPAPTVTPKITPSTTVTPTSTPTP